MWNSRRKISRLYVARGFLTVNPTDRLGANGAEEVTRYDNKPSYVAQVVTVSYE